MEKSVIKSIFMIQKLNKCDKNENNVVFIKFMFQGIDSFDKILIICCILDLDIIYKVSISIISVCCVL